MPTLEQVNLFYVALAVVCIPMLIGFFSEAGKDIYNKVRKKPSEEDIRRELEQARTDFIEMCKQNRTNCPTSNNVVKDMTELKTDNNHIKERQRILREERMPRVETALAELKGDVKDVSQKVDNVNQQIEKLFNLWNDVKIKGAAG